MPFIQPTLPSMVTPTSRKTDATEAAKNYAVSPPQTPQSNPGSFTDDLSVKPAAPPSAVQMQIKAMITEQALSLEVAKEDDPDNQT